VPKIISECCELVKLFDINCSGLAFFRPISVHIIQWVEQVGLATTDQQLFGIQSLQ